MTRERGRLTLWCKECGTCRQVDNVGDKDEDNEEDMNDDEMLEYLDELI